MDTPKVDEVQAQLARLYDFKRFRGPKLRRLLGFLVEQWLVDGGAQLTEKFIGEALMDEDITFEEDSDKFGYPKTRANLAHVRNRLKAYYETDGYRDPVIIKLNPGSYAPVIAHNPTATAMPELDPAVARLILRAKTAIDTRTLRGAVRAVHYYSRIPLGLSNPRQIANVLFIPMAVAPIISSMAASVRTLAPVAIPHIRASGVEPWECTFAEACCEACYEHNWQKALNLFELAIANSQGEATYFWWYTALLASQGRIQESIDVLDKAVRHYCRTNIATRTDLALLQIMAGRFEEAEEMLSASFDFAAKDNPLIACNFVILYEAQDRLNDAAASMASLYKQTATSGEEPVSTEDALLRIDTHTLLSGMFTLIAGRSGAIGAASEMVDVLLACKAKRDKASSVEIALGLIGLGRLDDALEWLNKAAFEEDDPLAMWFHIFPPLRHLRGHRGYEDLLKKLGLSLHLGR